MRTVLAVSIALLWCGALTAGTARASEGWGNGPALQLSAGADVVHARGEPALEIRAVAPHWSVYALAVNGAPHVGVDMTLPTRLVNVSVGAAVSRSDEIVGTPLRYEIRLDRRIARNWTVQLMHESNCARVCREIPGARALPHGAANRPNSGYNILSLGYRL